MLAMLVLSLMACGADVVGEQAATPAAPVVACTSCDLLPVSVDWFEYLVRDSDRIIASSDEYRRSTIMDWAEVWALVRRVMPNAFSVYFKDAYWQEMKRHLEEVRKRPGSRWLFFSYAVRMRNLFPERADQLGLDEAEFQRGLCELRQLRLGNPDMQYLRLHHVLEAFPDQKGQLEIEFGDQADAGAIDADALKAWTNAMSRSSCRCEWSDAARQAFINAVRLDVKSRGRLASVPGVGDFQQRILRYRSAVEDEIRYYVAQDASTWRSGDKSFSLYITALRGVDALRQADILLGPQPK